jgi:hypothetical protein
VRERDRFIYSLRNGFEFTFFQREVYLSSAINFFPDTRMLYMCCISLYLLLIVLVIDLVTCYVLYFSLSCEVSILYALL